MPPDFGSPVAQGINPGNGQKTVKQALRLIAARSMSNPRLHDHRNSY